MSWFLMKWKLNKILNVFFKIYLKRNRTTLIALRIKLSNLNEINIQRWITEIESKYDFEMIHWSE